MTAAFICSIDEGESTMSLPIPNPTKFRPERKDITYGKPPKSIIEAVRKELRKLLDAPDLEDHLGEIGRAAMQADDFIMCFRAPEVRMHKEHALTLPGVVSQPTNAETYGATVIREAIAALKDFKAAETKESPSDVIFALIAARQAGMTDVSEALERKLLGAPLKGARPVRPVGGLAAPAPHPVGPDRTALSLPRGTTAITDARAKKRKKTPKYVSVEVDPTTKEKLNGAFGT